MTEVSLCGRVMYSFYCSQYHMDVHVPFTYTVRVPCMDKVRCIKEYCVSRVARCADVTTDCMTMVVAKLLETFLN